MSITREGLKYNSRFLENFPKENIREGLKKINFCHCSGGVRGGCHFMPLEALFLGLIGPLEEPLSASQSLIYSENSIINHHQCCQAVGPS